MLTVMTVKANKSQYKQCEGNPTFFRWAKSIEKIIEKRRILT